MERAPALAVVDFADIPSGIASVDSMLKASPIAWLRSGTVSRARYLTLFGGTPAAVEVALDRCLALAGPSAVDHVLLADAHGDLVAGLSGARHGVDGGALAILQTATAASAVLATERALKTAPVTLVEIRLAEDELAGQALVVLQGALHDIDAAVEAALAALSGRTGTVFHTIIAAPHEATSQRATAPSRFAASPTLALPGESG